MMKKITLLLSAMVAMAATVSADTESDALLDALAEKIAELGNYRVEFAVSVADQSTRGTYEVAGDRYRIVTPDIELFCDGATKYEVNLLDREILIDEVDPDDRTVLGNPTKLFDFLDGSYSHRYLGTALIDGVKCEHVELTEANVEDARTTDAFIDTATGLPVRLSYTMGLLNTKAVIDVVGITPHITTDGTFDFVAARYPGFEIIDFR